MKQEDLVYAREFGTQGTRFHRITKELAQWSKAPRTDKPRFLYGVEENIGDVIVITLRDTYIVKATIIVVHSSLLA